MSGHTCSFGPRIVPCAGQHVLCWLFNTELFLDCILSEGLDPVIIHHFLQILGRNTIITIQAVWEVEYGLYLQIEKVPGGHVYHKVFLVLAVDD